METATALLLLAIWAQGALAMVLLFVLGRRRLPRIARGEIRIADIALDSSAWPVDARQASNAFDNQFQLPVLFFAGCGMALYLGAGSIEVALAWLFVGTRIAHAAIHVTTNQVVARFVAYMAGFVTLIAFWALLLVRLVAGLV